MNNRPEVIERWLQEWQGACLQKKQNENKIFGIIFT